MSVAGKVVLVSDATHAIGATIAREFAERGAHVHTLASEAEAERLRHDLTQSSGDMDVAVDVGDVTDLSDASRLVDGALARHGRIDALVNTHHTEGSRPVVDTHALELEEWDEIYRVNVRACFTLCQLVLPHMVAQADGTILTIASTTGLQAAAYMTANNTASAAAIHLCRSLAVEYQRHNIRVNAVVVAGTWHSSSVRIREGYAARDTEGDRSRLPDSGPYVMPTRSLQKIAQAFVSLTEPESDYITGGVIAVDGCLSAGLATSALLENASTGRWQWPT
jgi:NAD(P)-dependent dehydrogenase (short-subunit alcohol dehydrogenase family)